MTSAATRTGTQISTITKITHVTRKMQADFLAILDTYGYFSQDYAANVIHDVRLLLDEEVIERITFTWTGPGGNRVLEELEYIVILAGIGLADDRSGGIRYQRALASADFHVRLVYNRRWREMAEDERATIRERLLLRWGPAGQLDYSGGRRVQERTYAKDGYGLIRNRYTTDG